MKKPIILDFDSYAVNEKKKKSTYSYACAMLDFNFPDVKDIHETIDKEDVYHDEEEKGKFGLEKETHVTLLYGIHEDVSDDEVKDICTSFEYEPFLLHNLSFFDNPKFDVLKFDIKAPLLHKCNKKLTKLPHTTDYPDYHPHATVAYLKKGSAKKYVKKYKDEEYTVTPKGIIYSKPDGKKHRWKIDLVDK